MGFFQSEVEDKPALARKRAAAKSSVDLASTPRGCDNCSLRENWSWISTPQMPISGNTRTGDILVLGEGPGDKEDRDGMAFVGPSGNMLRHAIPGRDLDRVAFQNAVRCRPKDNANPSLKDMHACSVFLDEDVNQLPIKAILGVGAVPLSRFWDGGDAKGKSITYMHGTRFPVLIAGKVLWYYPVIHPSFIMRTGHDRSPAHGVFQSDVKKFFREVDNWRKPRIWKPDPGEILCPSSLDEAQFYLAEMKPPFGIDLESNKLRPYLKDAVLLTAAISDGDVTMAFPIDHPENPTTWGLDFLLEVASKHRWIAHNALMELSWMMFHAQKARLDWVSAPFEDSMAIGRLYHQREHLLSLALLSRIHLGVDIKQVSKVNVLNLINTPLEDVLPYNGLDAQASAKLFRLLRRHVEDVNYTRFIETIHSTCHMELMGLPANLDVVADLKDEWQGKMDAVITGLHDIYEVQQFEREKQIEFSIDSSTHIGQALVEYGKVKLPKTSHKDADGKKADGVQWSTDEEHLREFAADNPLAMGVIDYREAQKNISTYLDATIRHCGESVDGLLHPSYTTLFVATTRLSCNDPNIQNDPKRRHKEIRRRIQAPRGHILLAADMGQIDARIYGCATKDHNLITSFIEDEDIHSYWRDQALDLYPDYLERLARKTNETKEEKILKGARDIIKSDFVFATFYGSQPEACADRTGIPLPLAKRLTEKFWKRYPSARSWVKGQEKFYAATGSVFTLCGVERHGILYGNRKINTPIQGTTAHVVNDAQNDLSRQSVEYGDPYLHPRINVHDDLTFIVPDQEDKIEEYMHMIAKAMTKIRYDWQIVPFTVEFQCGYDWYDMHPITTIKGGYIR